MDYLKKNVKVYTVCGHTNGVNIYTVILCGDFNRADRAVTGESHNFIPHKDFRFTHAHKPCVHALQ